MADSRVSSLTAVSGADLLSTDVLYLEHSSTLSSAKITVAELTTGIKTQGQFLSSASLASAYQPIGAYVTSNSQSAAIAEFVTSASLSVRYVARTDSRLIVGYDSVVDNDGTVSAGTYIPVHTGSNFKRMYNGGAFTFQRPTLSQSVAVALSVLVVNVTGAGAITTTGFSKVTGDSFTTTDGHEFLCRVETINDGSAQYSVLDVVALQ